MAETVELPELFQEIGFAPRQYGLAWLLDAGENYAQKPLDQAYDFQQLLPHFAAMSAEALGLYDVTAFYSRRRPELDEDATKELIEADLRAYAAAVVTGNLDLYVRGEVSGEIDTGKRPYDLPFLPDVISACGWVSRAAAQAAVKHPFHEDAARNAPTWFEQAALVKLKPRLVRDTGALALAFVPQEATIWDFRQAPYTPTSRTFTHDTAAA